ncbi:HesA/MoeB/ThiF family protein [Nonomuraea diastatica]|uniref:HesA/MoeB/ThiF family protein n=1 Tax=Nonomuraea diastatica TaxID=1848329 RepID=UPI001408FE53|nr:ThiF family adenylyltransferase [Nonomuraea diastatica]
MTEWRPRLRESVIVQAEGHELLFLCTADRTVKRFAADDFVKHVIKLLDGTRTYAEIERSVGDSQALGEVLQILTEERLLSRVGDLESSFSKLGEERAEFYDRQLRLLQDFCDQGRADVICGARLQERVDRSTAVVCGVGGLGGWVVLSLANAGVGTVRLCDFDRVEPSNLTRQALFALADVGAPKVEAAAARLRAANPFVTVETFDRRVTSSADLTDLVDGAGIVINAMDLPTPNDTATWVSEACRPDVPHILGTGYAYHIGVLGATVLPGRTACWACVRAATFADHGRHRMESLIGKRQKAGAIGALCGLVGTILAWEAIRVLTGLEPALSGKWSEVDFWPLEIRSRPIPRRPDCPICGEERGGAPFQRPDGSDHP